MKAQFREVVQHMDPEYAQTLRAMLSRAGVSESQQEHLTTDAILKMFSTNGDMTRDEAISLGALLGATNTNKFGVKLSFAQRCEILGLSLLGFKREELSKVYRIDRRTVTHIVNPRSGHYENVKQELARLGNGKFIAQYITEDVIHIARAHRESFTPKNNKYANKRMGLHVVRGENCKYDHRVGIGWLDAGEHNVEESGWYYRDMDSDFPDAWLSPNQEARQTSMACYSAMLKDISDKLE